MLSWYINHILSVCDILLAISISRIQLHRKTFFVTSSLENRFAKFLSNTLCVGDFSA